jgi:hypothetical protein
VLEGEYRALAGLCVRRAPYAHIRATARLWLAHWRYITRRDPAGALDDITAIVNLAPERRI